MIRQFKAQSIEIFSYQLIYSVVDHIANDSLLTLKSNANIKEQTIRAIINLKAAQDRNTNVGRSPLVFQVIEDHTRCIEEIKQLKDVLQKREDKYSDFTTGYLKDLQNLKEQLYRQEKVGYEYYEVEYFDSSEIGDEKYLNLLNNKLTHLRQSFDKRTRQLTNTVQSKSAEVNVLRSQLKEIQDRMEYYGNPEYLIRKAIHLESDAYKIWKMIEDCKGTEYLFNVFITQKKGYGIDYKNIDKLLMSSNVYDREFDAYKQTLDNQLIGFMQKIMADVGELRQEQLNKQVELETYQKQTIAQFTQLNKNIQKVFHKCVYMCNQMLLKLALNIWKYGQIRIPDILRHLKQFQWQDINKRVTDYMIFSISQLQDKVQLLQQKLAQEESIRKQQETQQIIIQQSITQITQQLSIKTKITTEQELKLQQIDQKIQKQCKEVLNQLEFHKAVYTKYKQGSGQYDKCTMTDALEVQQSQENTLPTVQLKFFGQQNSQFNEIQVNYELQNSFQSPTPTKLCHQSIQKTSIVIPQPNLLQELQYQRSKSIEQEYSKQNNNRSNLIEQQELLLPLDKSKKKQYIRQNLRQELQGLIKLKKQYELILYYYFMMYPQQSDSDSQYGQSTIRHKHRHLPSVDIHCKDTSDQFDSIKFSPIHQLASNRVRKVQKFPHNLYKI